MKRQFLLSCFLVFTMSLFLTSCVKEEEYPNTPEIAFKEFKRVSDDSVYLVITFTDGDGDIGLDQNDTFAPHNPGSRSYFNFFATYFYKDNTGNFLPWDIDVTAPNATFDSLAFDGRIPVLTQNGQKQSLTGEIQLLLPNPYYYPGHTTFRYRVAIQDRAMNTSNWITTPELHPQ